MAVIARSVGMSKEFMLVECVACNEPAFWLDEDGEFFCDLRKQELSNE